MNPAGYMAKRVVRRPAWLAVPSISDIYSVSACISEDFADYIPHWKHNGYWFFDSPGLIKQVSLAERTDLTEARLFYYEVYDREFDGKNWNSLRPEASLGIQVEVPTGKQLEGFDVVTFWARTSPECSPLSCNSLAKRMATNMHCLLGSFDEAKSLLEAGKFENSEPGPYRIFAVYSVEWPN